LKTPAVELGHDIEFGPALPASLDRERQRGRKAVRSAAVEHHVAIPDASNDLDQIFVKFGVGQHVHLEPEQPQRARWIKAVDGLLSVQVYVELAERNRQLVEQPMSISTRVDRRRERAGGQWEDPGEQLATRREDWRSGAVSIGSRDGSLLLLSACHEPYSFRQEA
jgi:hypothetical protein